MRELKLRARAAARSGLLVLSVVALACATATAPATAAVAAPPMMAPLLPASPATTVADEYIVVLHEDTGRRDAAGARRQLRQQAVAAGGDVLFEYGTALDGFAVALPPDGVDTLRRNPAVAYLQPNLVHRQTDGTAVANQLQPGIPWHLDRIDQRDLPLDTQYSYTNDGSGVHAYIVDSGIRSSHVEFGGRVGSGYTAVHDGNGTEDCHNHGTFVASEVGGSAYGVAKQVTLHAVRVLDCSNSGTTAQIVAGMDWVAANHQDPNVANLSIQSFGGMTDTAMDQAAAGMIDAGVNLVLIAGNFNSNDCTNSPKDPRALIVGATTSSDSRNTGPNPSSYGACVDIWAPGAAITGAGSAHDTAVLSGWYGSSMAAPLVTGTIAMALQSHPTLTMQQAHDLVTGNATAGVLSNLGDSPNRLLYSLDLDP